MQEIERKFLIKEELWKPVEAGTKMQQGYLSVDSERVVRVRVAGEKAFLTVKGKVTGIVRTELEYEIPKNEAEVLLNMCLNSIVEKTRYKEKIGNLIWEIDVFEGNNKGLIMAEVELENENQEVDLPIWIKEEVSHDRRYFNSWLSRNPFSSW
jgi:adenylate cyclase